MSSLAIAPPPWDCKCDAYWLLYYHSGPLPDYAYSPLEASSPEISGPTSGQFKGGWATIQIIRYHETPVGPYDEMVLIPGYFEVPPEKSNKKGGQNIRTTRVYVSQKDTTFNGRRNWNIPKHLACFTFERLNSPNHLKVQVFPPDSPETPFFTAILQPFTWTPAFPFSTNAAPYLGMDLTLTQPPLPASGNEREEELCGTDVWLRTVPYMGCDRTRACWVDVEQPSDDERIVGWWPTVKPWKVGLWMEGANLKFGKPEVLSIADQ